MTDNQKQKKTRPHLTYAVLALILAPLLMFDTIVNDVVPFEEFVRVCAEDVLDVPAVAGSGRNGYDKVVLSLQSGNEAALHGIYPGFRAASIAIAEDQDYCVHFNANGRTKAIYHVTVDGSAIVEYEEVADRRSFDVHGLFYLGLVLMLVVGPYQLYRYFQQTRTAD